MDLKQFECNSLAYAKLEKVPNLDQTIHCNFPGPCNNVKCWRASTVCPQFFPRFHQNLEHSLVRTSSHLTS